MSAGLHPVTSEAVVEATPWLVALLLVPLTHLGSVLIIVPALGLAYFRRPRLVAPWLGAVAGYYSVMAGIKSLNSATRPEVAPPISPEPYPEAFSFWYEHATSISSTSFPSGNVMVATVLAGLIALDTEIGTFKQRLVGGASFVAVIAYSRVGLGVHYPIDAVGGILLGVGFLSVVVFVRNRARDEVAAVFALAAVCAAWSLWVTTPITEPPALESIAGSNRTIAFGGAVGALVSWRLTNQYADRVDPETSSILSVILVGAAVAAYVGISGVSSPLLLMLRSALFAGAMIALPWVLPNRFRPVEAQLGVGQSDRTISIPPRIPVALCGVHQ